MHVLHSAFRGVHACFIFHHTLKHIPTVYTILIPVHQLSSCQFNFRCLPNTYIVCHVRKTATRRPGMGGHGREDQGGWRGTPGTLSGQYCTHKQCNVLKCNFKLMAPWAAPRALHIPNDRQLGQPSGHCTALITDN